MNSRSLVYDMKNHDEEKVYKWHKIKYSSEWLDRISKVLNPIYDKRGVYVFKTKPAFNRLRGESDILYIGHGRVGNRIYAALGKILQIQKYKIRNYRHNAKKYIFKLIEEGNYDISFNYCLCSKSRAKALERSYLMGYKEEHFELPPLNSQIG